MEYADLFDEILSNPAIYVGNRSVVNIQSFMSGYIHATWRDDGRREEDLYFGFQLWLANRFSVSRTQEWAKIMIFFSSSEVDAFERTTLLWEEYKKSAT